MIKPIDETKITRFEVIDKNGRQMVEWDVTVSISIQDDGKTMKVFIKQPKDK